MPQRRVDFHTRAIEKAKARGDSWLRPHVYNTTTTARVMQGRHFVRLLKEHVENPTPAIFPAEFNAFMVQDMYSFGAVNSLRSALDSFAHEIVFYFGGHSDPRLIQFFNLLTPKISVDLPIDLATAIDAFRSSQNCIYLNRLRNAMQHRGYPITEHHSWNRNIGIPDDPRVEPGEETYEDHRGLVGTLNACDEGVRAFILEAYDLARP
jgi:hypothetical protein